jgi:hypothetical protein
MPLLAPTLQPVFLADKIVLNISEQLEITVGDSLVNVKDILEKLGTMVQMLKIISGSAIPEHQSTGAGFKSSTR